MTRENQLLLDDARKVYYCHPCQRHFRCRNGATNHASTAHVHRDEWCERCEWLFVREDALESHLNSSRLHQVCEVCSEDVGDYEELQEHIRANHYCCNACDAAFANVYALRSVRVDLDRSW